MGRKAWQPSAHAIEEARVARMAGANLDAIAVSILNISPKTLYAYLGKHVHRKTGEHKSELGKALTRAHATKMTLLPGYLYAVATNDKHPRQVDALKFYLARQGGPEWKDQLEVTGKGGKPLMPAPRRETPVLDQADVRKALQIFTRATHNGKRKKA